MSIRFFGEWFEELSDGFINGKPDVIEFFRHHIIKALTVVAGPMAQMVIPMALGTILGYAEWAETEYV